MAKLNPTGNSSSKSGGWLFLRGTTAGWGARASCEYWGTVGVGPTSNDKNTHTHTHTYTYRCSTTHRTQPHTHTRTHGHMHAHVHASTHTCTHTHTDAAPHTAHNHTHTRNTDTRTHTYTHAHTHAHTHTHTHTQTHETHRPACAGRLQRVTHPAWCFHLCNATTLICLTTVCSLRRSDSASHSAHAEKGTPAASASALRGSAQARSIVFIQRGCQVSALLSAFCRFPCLCTRCCGRATEHLRGYTHQHVKQGNRLVGCLAETHTGSKRGKEFSSWLILPPKTERKQTDWRWFMLAFCAKPHHKHRQRR